MCGGDRWSPAGDDASGVAIWCGWHAIVILPRKAVTELRKLLDDFEGDVTISLSDTRAEFGFGTVRLKSKLIDGTFPDYTRVIPQGNDRIMRVDVAAFSAAVDRVSTISSEKSRSVKLKLQAGILNLSASSTDASSAVEELGGQL